jgi:mono/diheme cytochrome c family protein
LTILAIAPVYLFASEPFYKTLDTPPAPELTPEEALAGFSLAPNFEIVLVAAEPLVEDPVAITWDEDGLMYVVEMRGYMPDAFGNGKDEPVGIVAQLEDLDGDGVYDERVVLLDALVLPRALAVVNEGLLVGEPPNLWLCPRATEGKKRIDCSKKKRLGVFGSVEANVEHDENGMLLGIDNWFYNAKSNRRIRLKNGRIESEPTLMRGQWGITSNNSGTLYYNTNSNLLMGDLYDAQPVIEAGNSAAAGLSIEVSKNDQLYAVRVNTGVNRAYVPGVLREDGRLNKPTSASGMVFYRGDQFPSTYMGDMFITEPAANALVHMKLKEDALAATTEHVLYPDRQWGEREFLASTDERFRPVDAKVGPDGALYVIDMYRGIIQDTMFMSDELREQILERSLDKPVGMGRIWKIAHKGGNEPTDSDFDSSTGLVKALSHGNGWHRDTAQRLLLDHPNNGLKKQLERLVRADEPVPALHALWILQGRDELTRDSVLQALNSQHTSLRIGAMKAGRDVLTLAELLPIMASEQPDVAHHAVMYLADYSTDPNVLSKLVEYTVSVSGDAVRLAAVYAAVAGNELQFADSLIASGQWSERLDGQTQFLKGLFAQAILKTPDASHLYLDFVSEIKERWVQRAVLSGFQEGASGESFERIVLPGPHDIFDDVPDDLWTDLSRTRKLFTWAGDDLPADTMPLTSEDVARKSLGQTYYAQRCAICHGVDGKGIGAIGPPLAGSSWVTGPTERLARIVLHGVKGEIEVLDQTWDSAMPGHAGINQFDNETAAGLMTYLHRVWGHSGRIISPDFVGEIRELEAGRRAQWTADELMAIDVNTHYRAYEGVYGGGTFELTITYDGQGLSIASVYFNGPLNEVTEGEFRFEPRAFQFEFVSDRGQISGVKVPLQGGAVLPRVSD